MSRWAQQGWPGAGQKGVASPANKNVGKGFVLWTGGPAGKGNFAAASAASAVPTAAPADDSKYTVITKANDKDEFVVKTLLGEFHEKGANHGRKVYQKVGNPNVHLYFWDGRDGPSFEGWWFGRVVGGDEVWSHNPGKAQRPPKIGWKIPFAGQVRNTLEVSPKTQQVAQDPHARHGPVLQEIRQTIEAAGEGLAQAREQAGDYTCSETMKQAEQIIMPHIQLLKEAQTKIASMGAMGAPKDLANNLRVISAQVQSEMAKIKVMIPKAAENAKNKLLEGQDKDQLELIVAEVNEKKTAAEDMVEKAVATFNVVDFEDSEGMKAIVEETEAAAKQAQVAIGEALAMIGKKSAEAKKVLLSKKGQEEATAKMNAVKTKLQEASRQLVPLRNARQQMESRANAARVVKQGIDMLAPAELEVDHVEEAVNKVLASEDVEAMREALKIIGTAEQKLMQVSKFAETRSKAADPILQAELKKLIARVTATQKRLTELRTVPDRMHQKELHHEKIKDIESKHKQAIEALEKVEKVIGPIKAPAGKVPIDDVLAAIKEYEAAAVEANKLLSSTKVTIATGLIEAKRYQPELMQATTSSLTGFQKDLDAAMKKLTDFRHVVANRKKTAAMEELASIVDKAEAHGDELEVASKFFEEDESVIADMPGRQIREAANAVTTNAAAVQKLVMQGQQLLMKRQMESKGVLGADGKMAGEDTLNSFKDRLRKADAKFRAHKGVPDVAQSHMVLQKIIDDASALIKTSEEKVEKYAKMVEALQNLPPEKEPENGGDGAKGKTGDSSAQQRGAMPKFAARAKAQAVIATKKLTPHEQAEATAQEAITALKSTARHIESQAKLKPDVAEELEELQPRVLRAQNRLEQVKGELKIGAEKQQIKATCEEAMGKITEATEAISKAVQVHGDGEVCADEKEFEKHAREASSAVGRARSFIQQKKLDAKSYSERGCDLAVEELSTVFAKLDEPNKQLRAYIKKTSEKKYAAAMEDANERIKKAEEKVQVSGETRLEFGDNVVDLPPLKMRSFIEKAMKTQAEAQDAITAARTHLMNQMKDAKNTSPDSVMVDEFKNLLDKVKDIESELDKQRASVKEYENAFVANRLLKEVTKIMEKLEEKIEVVVTVAAPFTSDKKDEFQAVVALSQVITALKQHMKDTSCDVSTLFDEMCGTSGGTVTEITFAGFFRKLKEKGTVNLNEKQVVAAFSALVKKGEAEFSREELQDQLKNRYLCVAPTSITSTFAVEGGKSLGKLEAGEVLEALGTPMKDEGSEMLRVKVRRTEDGVDGFVSLANNKENATTFLEEYTPYVAARSKTEAALKDAKQILGQANVYLANAEKAKEMQAAKTGPLMEARAELKKMKARTSKAQLTQTSVEKKMEEAQKKFSAEIAAEQKTRQEAAEKADAANQCTEATEKVDALVAEMDEALAAAEAVKPDGLDQPQYLKALGGALKKLEAAQSTMTKLEKTITAHLERVRSSSKAHFVEMRKTMVKLKVKMSTPESKCTKQIAALTAAREELSAGARVKTVAALREHMKKQSLKVEALFKKIGKPGQLIPLEAFRKYLQGIEGAGFTPEDLDLGLDCLGSSGVSLFALQGFLHEFYKCVKEVALTKELNVAAGASGESIKRIAVDEIVEVIGERATEKANNLERVQVKSLMDGQDGWVTLRGNSGTPFMEVTKKPFYICQGPSALRQEFPSTSAELRSLKIGEVMELLEGPRKEPPLQMVRVRGKATSDCKSGWATVKMPDGTMNFEPSTSLVVKSSTALTGEVAVGKGSLVRKLEVGEVVEQMEEPVEDKASGLTRVKVKCQDGKEGWASMKGNKGTSILEPSDKNFVCKRETPLETQANKGTSVRMLKPGELFEVIDTPKTSTVDGALRIRGRSLVDDSEGWFTPAVGTLIPWSMRYRCAVETTLLDRSDEGTAKALRGIEVGEMLEAVEAPVVEGNLRVRVRAERDGLLGFAAIIKDGTTVLEPSK